MSLGEVTLTIALDNIKSKLELAISPGRYKHSENVAAVAVKLAEKYEVDVSKAAIAGILHDCARNKTEKELFRLCEKFDIGLDLIMAKQPVLLHGYVGAVIAKTDYGIKDMEILNAIRFHTTGRENMGILEKIVFIADYIEPSRKFKGIDEIRMLAFKDIDKSISKAFDTTIVHLIKKGEIIHPDTIKARNYLLL